MSEVREKPRTRRPQTLAVRKSDVKPTGVSNRGRGRRQPTQGVLADLDRLISAPIKENRDLHRQVDKLSKLAVGAGSGIAERALRSLQRRISGTVDGGRRSSGRHSRMTAAASRTRGVGVGPGRSVSLSADPSPRPALRTGRATFTASGSPRDHAVAAGDSRPLVQLRLHLVYPLFGLVEVGPRRPDIHQGPPPSALRLRSRWGPSPCGRLSRPRTTTAPTSHPGGMSRRRAFPPTNWLLAGERTAGVVPTFIMDRSTGEASNYAPAASPRLRRRPSTWPPCRRH